MSELRFLGLGEKGLERLTIAPNTISSSLSNCSSELLSSDDRTMRVML